MRLLPYTSAFAITTMLVANPAYAQEICGGLGTGAQWIGGDEAGSDIATAIAPQEQMALVLGGNEYVGLFSLSTATEVRVEAQGRGAGDPQLDIFDADGQIMASDDDSGGEGAARAETPLDPGTYCVAVRSYDGSPMTSFVRIGRTDQEPLTTGISGGPADSTVQTNTLDTPAIVSGEACADARPMDGSLQDGSLTGIASVSENGFWGFSLETDAALTIKATNPDADPVITLFDGADSYIDENDDFDGLNAQIDIPAPLPAGDYCIQVSAVESNALPITTTVSVFDPAEVLRQQIAAGEIAPPLDGSFDVTDLGKLERRTLREVDLSDQASWFKFEMGPGLLLAEAVAFADGTDTWMVIFDDLGRQIGLIDDYGDSLNSLIATRMAGGTYLLGVKRLEDGGTGRARIVLEHYVPAP